MSVIEGGDQPQVRRTQHPVAEHVAAHVADPDDRHLIGIRVDPERPGMSPNALPRTASRDSHGLVVVSSAAAGSEGVAQPEAVVGGDGVRGVGERGGSLVRCHDEIRIVGVVAHGLRRGHHHAADDVIGEIQQAGDEHPVALHDLGAALLGIDGRTFHDETALGAHRDDDGVLHHLGLHQPEHLGAEVLAPIAPAQPAAGDPATAQVDALDTWRIHEDLELRPGQGHLRDPARVELERQHRPMASAVRGAERVGPKRGVHQTPQGTSDAILVEPGHGVEQLADRRVEHADSLCSVGHLERRVEPHLEQFDQCPGERRPVGEHALDRCLTERERQLP